MLISKNNLITNLSIIKNCLKTKIKSHGDEVKDFCYKKIPKGDSNRTYLAVISLDFALNKDGSYYPQVFSKKCKYIEKKTHY